MYSISGFCDLDVADDLARRRGVGEIEEVALDERVVVVDAVQAQLADDVHAREQDLDGGAVERAELAGLHAVLHAELAGGRGRLPERRLVDVAEDRARAGMALERVQQVRARAGGEVGDDGVLAGGLDRLVDGVLGEAADVAEGLAGRAVQQPAVQPPAERRTARRAVGVDVGHEGPGVEAVAMADPGALRHARARPRGERECRVAPRARRAGRQLGAQRLEAAGSDQNLSRHTFRSRRARAAGRARAHRRPRSAART